MDEVAKPSRNVRLFYLTLLSNNFKINYMESTLSIHPAPDFKPYIRFVYKKSDNGMDGLALGLIQQLAGVSNTYTTSLQKETDSGAFVYGIHPIADELPYFTAIIEQKYLKDPQYKEALQTLFYTLKSELEEPVPMSADEVDIPG